VPLELVRCRGCSKCRGKWREDINDIVRRFATTAAGGATGFTGVQIHAAMVPGQPFLSRSATGAPTAGVDRWKRARLLLNVIEAVRSAVSPQFCVQ